MAAPPSGTVTFLFTDIEGCTNLLGARPGDDAGRPRPPRRDPARARSKPTAATSSRPSATPSAPPSPPPPRPWRRLSPRSGRCSRRRLGRDRGRCGCGWRLHTGSAEERDGDYFGPPLNRVARLLSAGHGGQILLSAPTQELVRDALPEGADLRDLGEHRLKDLSVPSASSSSWPRTCPPSFPPLKTLDAPAEQPARPAHPARRARAGGRGRSAGCFCATRCACSRSPARAARARPAWRLQVGGGAPGRVRGRRLLRGARHPSPTPTLVASDHRAGARRAGERGPAAHRGS